MPTPAQSPFTVSNTKDETPGMAVGSLRVAILDANFSSLAPATPPSVSVTSPVTVPANQTTIAVMYQVTSVVGWTYAINFFASVSGGQPYLLGSDAQTLTGSPQSFTKTFSFAPSNASQTVTLTAAIVPDVTFDIPTGTAPFVMSPAAASCPPSRSR